MIPDYSSFSLTFLYTTDRDVRGCFFLWTSHRNMDTIRGLLLGRYRQNAGAFPEDNIGHDLDKWHSDTRKHPFCIYHRIISSRKFPIAQPRIEPGNFFLEAHLLPPGYLGHSAHTPGSFSMSLTLNLFQVKSCESVYGLYCFTKSLEFFISSTLKST